MMNGGKVPGGMKRVATWPTAVICATAASTFAPGWRNTFVTLTP